MAKNIIEKKLNEILGYLQVKPEVVIEEVTSDESEGETYRVNIQGDDLSFLIGYRGQSLDALQTILANMLFNELGEWKHVVIDINDYRDSRNDRIQDMVRNFIDRVRFHKSEVELPSMNSYERRQVHMFVSEYPDIMSESTGEGRDRRVVLKLRE